jgi:hypothetical protein
MSRISIPKLAKFAIVNNNLYISQRGQKPQFRIY